MTLRWCKMAQLIRWTVIRALKSEKLYNDELFLSKAFNVSGRKFQRINVSWHWRVMQNLRKTQRQIQSTSYSSNNEVEILEEIGYFLWNMEIWKELVMVFAKNTKFCQNWFVLWSRWIFQVTSAASSGPL